MLLIFQKKKVIFLVHTTQQSQATANIIMLVAAKLMIFGWTDERSIRIREESSLCYLG